jgi:hypothetical protein
MAAAESPSQKKIHRGGQIVPIVLRTAASRNFLSRRAKSGRRVVYWAITATAKPPPRQPAAVSVCCISGRACAALKQLRDRL